MPERDHISLRPFGQGFAPVNPEAPRSSVSARRRQQAAAPLGARLLGGLQRNILPAAASAALIAGYLAFAPVVTAAGITAFGLAGLAGGKTYATLKKLSGDRGIRGAFARAVGGTVARRSISGLTAGTLALSAIGLAAVRLDKGIKDPAENQEALTEAVVGQLASGKVTLGNKAYLLNDETNNQMECDNLRLNKIPGGNVEFTCTLPYQDGTYSTVHSEPFKASDLSVNRSGETPIVTPKNRDAFLKRAFLKPETNALGKEIRNSASVPPSLWFHKIYTGAKTTFNQVRQVLGLSHKPRSHTPG